MAPIKSPSIGGTKVELESGAQGKNYEPPELVQLFSASPLIQLKQEITCVPDSISSSAHCPGVMTVSDIDIKDLKPKNTLENTDSSNSQIGKCVLTPPLSVATPLEHMELDYVASANLEEDAPEEILLHDLVSHCMNVLKHFHRTCQFGDCQIGDKEAACFLQVIFFMFQAKQLINEYHQYIYTYTVILLLQVLRSVALPLMAVAGCEFL